MPLPLVETITAAGTLPSLWQGITEIYQGIKGRNDFIHALYFEARFNLDLIDSLDKDKLKDAVGTPAFAEVVRSFETSATLALVAGRDRKNYRCLVKLLRKHWPESLRPDSEDDEEENEKDVIKNVLDALDFSARKIEALRRISRIADNEASPLKGIKLDVRIANIKKALQEVRVHLGSIIKKSKRES